MDPKLLQEWSERKKKHVPQAPVSNVPTSSITGALHPEGLPAIGFPESVQPDLNWHGLGPRFPQALTALELPTTEISFPAKRQIYDVRDTFEKYGSQAVLDRIASLEGSDRFKGKRELEYDRRIRELDTSDMGFLDKRQAIADITREVYDIGLGEELAIGLIPELMTGAGLYSVSSKGAKLAARSTPSVVRKIEEISPRFAPAAEMGMKGVEKVAGSYKALEDAMGAAIKTGFWTIPSQLFRDFPIFKGEAFQSSQLPQVPDLPDRIVDEIAGRFKAQRPEGRVTPRVAQAVPEEIRTEDVVDIDDGTLEAIAEAADPMPRRPDYRDIRTEDVVDIDEDVLTTRAMVREAARDVPVAPVAEEAAAPRMAPVNASISTGQKLGPGVTHGSGSKYPYIMISPTNVHGRISGYKRVSDPRENLSQLRTTSEAGASGRSTNVYKGDRIEIHTIRAKTTGTEGAGGRHAGAVTYPAHYGVFDPDDGVMIGRILPGGQGITRYDKSDWFVESVYLDQTEAFPHRSRFNTFNEAKAYVLNRKLWENIITTKNAYVQEIDALKAGRPAPDVTPPVAQVAEEAVVPGRTRQAIEADIEKTKAQINTTPRDEMYTLTVNAYKSKLKQLRQELADSIGTTGRVAPDPSEAAETSGPWVWDSARSNWEIVQEKVDEIVQRIIKTPFLAEVDYVTKGGKPRRGASGIAALRKAIDKFMRDHGDADSVPEFEQIEEMIGEYEAVIEGGIGFAGSAKQYGEDANQAWKAIRDAIDKIEIDDVDEFLTSAGLVPDRPADIIDDVAGEVAEDVAGGVDEFEAFRRGESSRPDVPLTGEQEELLEEVAPGIGRLTDEVNRAVPEDPPVAQAVERSNNIKNETSRVAHESTLSSPEAFTRASTIAVDRDIDNMKIDRIANFVARLTSSEKAGEGLRSAHKYIFHPSTGIIAKGGRGVLIASVSELMSKTSYMVQRKAAQERMFIGLGEAFDNSVVMGESTIPNIRRSDVVYEYSSPQATGQYVDEFEAYLEDIGYAGSLADYIENPQLWTFTDTADGGPSNIIKKAMRYLRQHLEDSVNKANELGAEIKEFNLENGGIYLPHITKNMTNVEVMGRISPDMKKIGSPKSHARNKKLPTMRDVLFDNWIARKKQSPKMPVPAIEPEMNIINIYTHVDNFKAKAVGYANFILNAGGKTLDQIINPSKYNLPPSAASNLFDSLRKKIDTQAKTVNRIRNRISNLEDRVAASSRIVGTKKGTAQIKDIQDQYIETQNIITRIFKSLDTHGSEISSDAEIINKKGKKVEQLPFGINNTSKELVELINGNNELGKRLQGLIDTVKGDTPKIKMYLDEIEQLSKQLETETELLSGMREDMSNARNILMNPTKDTKLGVTYIRGINAYFPDDQAEMIIQIRREAKSDEGRNWNVVENMNRTVLSGDASPMFYTMYGMLFHPLPLIRQMTKTFFEMSSVVPEFGKLDGSAFFRARSEETRRMLENNPEFVDHVIRSGQVPGIKPMEYRTGYVPNILDAVSTPYTNYFKKRKGLGKLFDEFNDYMYRVLLHMEFEAYLDNKRILKKYGINDEVASVAASDASNITIPRIAMSNVRHGISPARATWERRLFTSPAFVRRPTVWAADVMAAMAKLIAHGVRNPMDALRMANPSMHGKEVAEILTPEEILKMHMFIKGTGTALGIAAMWGLYTGVQQEKRGEELVQHILDHVTPGKGKFLMGPVGLMAGPFRGAILAIAPSEPRVMGNTLTEQKVPFGGVLNYPTNRLSAAARTVANQVRNKDFSGNDIVLDNGFTEGFNRSIAIVESSVVPIAAKAPINLFRAQGKRWLDFDIPFLTDPDVKTKDLADYTHDGLAKDMFHDALGQTMEHVSAYSKRDDAFSSYAREQGWGIERDREGRISIHGYQPWQIAQFRKWDEDTNDGKIYRDIRQEVFFRAQSPSNKNANDQKELYLLMDDRDTRLQTISDNMNLPPDHYDWMGPASARDAMSSIEKKYFDDRSDINRGRDLDPHEEPEDPDSDEHLLWRYYSLFDMATVSKEAGITTAEILARDEDPKRYRDLEFDVERFSSLFKDLKKTLDPEEIEYINKNRNLAELDYPERLQTIKKDMRAISDRKFRFTLTHPAFDSRIFELTWWELMDEEFTRPLLLDELTNQSYGSLRNLDMSNPVNVQKIEDRLDKFFNVPDGVSFKNHRSDFEKMDDQWVGTRTFNSYISDAYDDIISRDGYVYKIRKEFIEQNKDIRGLLLYYGFEFPGRSELEKDIQEGRSELEEAIQTGEAQLVGP